jgi:hypothetical protein
LRVGRFPGSRRLPWAMEQIRAEDVDLGSEEKVQEAKGDLGAERSIKPKSTLFLKIDFVPKNL